jgi:YD repeat-containing protein
MTLGSLHKKAPPSSRARKRTQRRLALLLTLLFTWTFVLAPPLTALAHDPAPRSLGMRHLSVKEMQNIRGSGGGVHPISVSESAGPSYPWEGSFNGTNTGNGNKLTSIPIVGWTQRGGLPIQLTLNHNSQSTHNAELGHKWTFSYDIYLVASGGSGSNVGNMTVHWGNDLSYVFTNNGSNVFTPPTGIYDSLVLNVDGSLTLTKTNQTTYHFNTRYYCDTITDENANSLSIAHNSGNFITSITDASGRAITLGYNSSNQITSITDPLSRVWTYHMQLWRINFEYVRT